MNIMLISDDHGYEVFDKAFEDAKGKYGSIDIVLHAGDTEGIPVDYYEKISGVTTVIVRGNNDYDDTPLDKMLRIGGKTIFLTHGSNYKVYSGIERIASAGEQRGADIVVYGHTHIANYQKGSKIEIINPGSLAGIRSGIRTYAMLIIEENETKVELQSF